MAMWRRPPGVEPPAVLFAFDPVDWPAGSMSGAVADVRGAG